MAKLHLFKIWSNDDKIEGLGTDIVTVKQVSHNLQKVLGPN